MNKITIITILLALVAMAGQAQVNYHIDGNTGHPDFTGTLYLYDSGRKWRNHITQRYIAKCEEMCTYQQKRGNSCQTAVHRGWIYTR